MIRHIVMWELPNGSQKETQKQEIKKRLLQLNGVVPEIQAIEVHFNNSAAPESNYDVLLSVDVADITALEAYQVHPAHKEVGAFIKPLVTARACVDFTL